MRKLVITLLIVIVSTLSVARVGYADLPLNQGRELRRLLNALDPLVIQGLTRPIPSPTEENIGAFGLACISTLGPIRENVILLRSFADQAVRESKAVDPLHTQREILELWATQMIGYVQVLYGYCGQSQAPSLGRVPEPQDVQSAIREIRTLSGHSRMLANNLDR